MAESIVIGVCAYNAATRIIPTLEALVAQDRLNGRVTRTVVVDNNSTDGTSDAIRSFAKRHPAMPIEVIAEPKPGKVEAMRTLIRSTDEPYMMLTDDDTLPDPMWAARLALLFDEHPRAGAASGPVKPKWEAGPTRLAQVYVQSLGDQDFGPTQKRLDEPLEFLMGASLALRRQAFEESKWMTHSRLVARTGASLECGAEDAEVCFLIRQAGWEIWWEPRAPMLHRIPAGRQTAEYLARLRGSICRGEPKLRWIAGGADPSWKEKARIESERARKRYLKTLLFDWRPTRRRIRLAERKGKMDGWSALARELTRP
jgi:glycosyltransferase involved in cell wall biosynthesis